MAAALSNFTNVQKAYTLAVESSGSAMQENEAYMESLSARTNNLKATFQDLANNVIDDELVGSLLDLANNALGVLNTGLGQTLTQIGLLAGVGWGATSLLKISNLLPAIGGSFTTFFSVIKNGASATATAMTAAGTATTAFGAILSSALPITLAVSAAIVGIVAIVKKLKQSVEDAKLENVIKKMQSVNDQIDETSDKLKTAKERLDELNNTPVADRGEDWQAERDELELLIRDYEDLIRLLEKERAESAKNIATRQVATGYRAVADVQTMWGESYEEHIAKKYSSEQVEALTAEYKTEEAAVLALAKAFDLSSDPTKSSAERVADYKKQLNNLGITFAETLVSAEEYNKQQYEVGSGLVDLTVKSKVLTEEQKKQISAWLDANTVRVEAIRTNGAQTDAENNLLRVYDRLSGVVGGYADKQETASNAVDGTTNSVYQQIKAQEGLNKKLDTVQSALDDYASSGKMTTSVLDSLESIIPGITDQLYDESGALTKVGEEALKSAEALLKFALAQRMSVGQTGSGAANKEHLYNPNMSLWEGGSGGGVDSETQAILDLLNSLYTGKWKPGSTTSGGSGGSSSTSTPAWVKQAEAAFAKLEHMRNMDLISEEEYYAELNRLNEKYYAGKSDYLDKYWSYEEKYYQWKRDKEKEALRAVLQAQVDALNTQKDNLDKVASAAQKQISDKLEELNGIVDEINAKYDAELEALEAQNDALDDQINKEKLLQTLAKAQATMKYVFKDGRFQYVSDVDAVSDAKSDLAEFEREQALKKAKEEIEERRQLALKDVQDEIDHWTQLSEIWNNYTTDYENSINMQLYLQKYGMEMEQLTWEQRLAQARQFVSEYNATMASLSNAQTNLDNFDSNYSSGQSDEEKLAALKKEYWEARERNDAAGMESANRRANIIRGLGDVVTADKAIAEAKRKQLAGESGPKAPYAMGTFSATPGLHLVGEQGPELRVLNKGDGILSADMTRNLYKMATAPQLFMQQATGGGNTNISVANITLPNVRNAQDFLDGLRNMAYQRAYARA